MDNLIALTIDYETWHPIPSGKHIDWEADVFTPAEQFLNICDQERIKMTFMAELGEYLWLSQNMPSISARMADQWRTAILSGHDVQLHLHPNWLPELGARFEEGEWTWDWSKAKCSAYPGDLAGLIRRCKDTLMEAIQPVKPDYKVTSFRAGAYMVQPFKRLHDALLVNGIYCDTSVYAGGYSQERGYDFRLAYSNHQPYWANPYDPQLKAPPAEAGIVEIPVFTYRMNERWSVDGDQCRVFAKQFLAYARERNNPASGQPGIRYHRFKHLFSSAYSSLRRYRHRINRLMPRSLAYRMTSYHEEYLPGQRYFVAIGHTKGAHDFKAMAANLRMLKDSKDCTFITLSAMAHNARQELSGQGTRGASEEARYQVAREYSAIMGSERNEAQSHYLQEMIPMDRMNVLDLGCGAGYWSSRIADLYPWMHVTGIDYGEDFISKARSAYHSSRLKFQREDFSALSFSDETFDCIYADNTLEHAYDVEKTLSETYRVLRTNGMLVAAIPSDARNPGMACDNHTWKTAPHEVELRLKHAGFVNVEIAEIDTYHALGMPPYPPSKDMMMFVRAWKRTAPLTKSGRALEAMDWVYSRLSPDKSQDDDYDPVAIVAGGYAYCWGYTVVLGTLLQKEGYTVRWLTMFAKDHPRGKGVDKLDSHEVLLIDLDGRECILDPMANVFIPYSFGDILRCPELAAGPDVPDKRYLERRYDLYATGYWYRRVVRYGLRSNPAQKTGRFWLRRVGSQ